MKPRICATRVIIVFSFIILLLASIQSPISYDGAPNETITSEDTNKEALVEVIPDSLLDPNECAIPTSDTDWYWAPATTLYSAPYGAADNPSNLGTDDESLCIMSEEYSGTSYQIDLRFRTAAVYAHQYLNLELRLDFRQVWSLFGEDLKFYVGMATATGTEGYYYYVGQLADPGVYTFDIGYLHNHDVLTARSIFIRILGAIESGDGTGNSYNFDFLGIGYNNHYPRIESHSCAAAEGNILYARYGSSPSKDYAELSWTIYTLDGYADITSLQFRYGTADRWFVRWTSSGGFSIIYEGATDASWAELLTAYCTTSTTTYTRTVTFAVRINWGHPSAEAQGSPSSSLSFFKTDSYVHPYSYKVESRLGMQTTPSISESRVNADGTCSYSGDVEYYNSPAHWSPRYSTVDIQVRRTNPSTTGWIYTAEPASDGTFTVNPSTSSTAGTNSFELRVAPQGGTTQLLTSTPSDTVIGDRAVVSSGSIGSTNYNPTYGGGVQNTGINDQLFLELEWETSGIAITSGTVSWRSSGDTVSMSYESDNSRWEGLTYARSTTGELTYNDLTVDIGGVTSVSVEPSYKVVWDEIVILTTVVENGDNYVNIGDTITIRVTAQLSHLGHALDPTFDTLYMNGIEMSDGGTYFTYSVSHSYPGQWTYSVDDSSAIETTYGITKIATGKPSISCTWDTFAVNLFVDDAHVSIYDTVRIWAQVTRSYDGSIFTDSMGSVVLRHTTSSDILMTYSSSDEMWYADITQNSVNMWSYFIYSISDTTEGITTVGKGLYFDGMNDYVDCTFDSSLDLTTTLTLSTWFYGDGTDWGSGMYIVAKKDNNNAQYSLYIHSDGTLYFVYYNTTIREVLLQTGVTRNTWHHVTVTVDETILNCWYDGVHVQDDYSLPTALKSYSSVPVYIGAQKSGAGTAYHFEGFISEVSIYSTILSDVECELLYQGQYPETSNLRLHLTRASIDISGSSWNDLSTSSNDGTIFQATVLLGSLPMSDAEVVRPIWDGVIISISDPIEQVLSLGQNASGIVVTAIYVFDGLPYDGLFQLNNTLFSYLTPGQRGYTVSSISDDSYNLTGIVLNDETYAIWNLLQVILHLDPLEDSILVSTIYDPQEFSVEVYLTNSSMNLISGWINITIDGEDYVVFCDGIVNSIFNYAPLVSKAYTLEAVFEGDSDYGSTDASVLLTATPRDITYTTEIPTEITALISSPFGFLNVYDNDFGGEFQGVTYMRNLPINASFSIWWTISSDYGNPRIFMGTWNITSGEGISSLVVPWDLDGNGWLTSTDFICYFTISLDGLGIYENITIETPVNVLHSLEVELQIPTLIYSDQSTLDFQIHPLYDPSFTDGLDLTIRIYVSDDNTTWVFIGETTTTALGWQSMNWTCTDSGTLFFKAETVSTELYTESSGYAHSAVEKETTVLTIVRAGNFTYSDQGVLVALLSTDDGEPLPDQTVFLELLDGTWISIGSGLTNDSGHVSILWTPTLPADTYSIQIRMSLSGSQYYLTPDNAAGLLEVGKELTVVSIDFSTAVQGFIRARVTDNDGTPVPSIQVHFYVGSNHDYQGAGTTDNDGYTRMNITLSDGELLEAVVNEDNFYYGANQEVIVTMPPDLMFIGTIMGSVFLLAAGITVSRKVIRGRRVSGPPSPEEVSRALEEERDSIPERVREHSEKRLAELDGVGKDSGESSETLSIDDDSI